MSEVLSITFSEFETDSLQFPVNSFTIFTCVLEGAGGGGGGVYAARMPEAFHPLTFIHQNCNNADPPVFPAVD
jgi:hypothetical protein